LETIRVLFGKKERELKTIDWEGTLDMQVLLVDTFCAG